ncbi:acyltransferase [Salinifilum aidingensis]
MTARSTEQTAAAAEPPAAAGSGAATSAGAGADPAGGGSADSASTGSGSAGAASAGSGKSGGHGYLYQIDLFRLLTFAAVILVHTLSAVAMLPLWPGQLAQTLLHFTREAFFALTGFVLTYQALRRPLPAATFWRKRFPLVAGPYVVWTVVYWFVATWPVRDEVTFGEAVFGGLLPGVVTGSGWYHLYFLLVTLQVYLVFPALVGLLRATAGGHRWVLLISLAAQVGVAWCVIAAPFARWLWDNVDVTVLGYQFYTVLGAVAAMHFDAWHAWVRRHGLWFGVAFLAALAWAIGSYSAVVARGESPVLASNVFQPFAIPYFVAVIAALYAVGAWWAARRRPGGAASRVVDYASDRSFGIFLAHPLVLVVLVFPARALAGVIGVVPATALLYLATVLGTVVLADVLRRLPGSKVLTGRPRVPWGRFLR